MAGPPRGARQRANPPSDAVRRETVGLGPGGTAPLRSAALSVPRRDAVSTDHPPRSGRALSPRSSGGGLLHGRRPGPRLGAATLGRAMMVFLRYVLPGADLPRGDRDRLRVRLGRDRHRGVRGDVRGGQLAVAHERAHARRHRGRPRARPRGRGARVLRPRTGAGPTRTDARQAATGARSSAPRRRRRRSPSSAGRCERSTSSERRRMAATRRPRGPTAATRGRAADGGRAAADRRRARRGDGGGRRDCRGRGTGPRPSSARGEDRRVIAAGRVGRDVQVAEVEQHPGGRRVEAAHEVAHRERVVAAPPRPGIHRREVLDRHGDAKGLRPLEERDEGSLLEQGALAEARGRRAVGFHEVQAVVGDELGARLRGVVDQALERAVAGGACPRSGRRARGARAAGRCRCSCSRSARAWRRPWRRSASIGARRRVHLHPAEPGGDVGGQHGGRRPGVAVDVRVRGARASPSQHSPPRPRGRCCAP